jgi:lipoic acid synthetase
MPKTQLFDIRPNVKEGPRGKRNRLPENPETRQHGAVGPGRFPSWLHRKLPKGSALADTGKVMEGQRLHTVCEEAKCPNLLECWSKKTATFLIMGKACTRACGFCDIDFAKVPPAPDPAEPKRVAESVLQLGLNHVVITMVARDDLSDGGAGHLAAVIEAVRGVRPTATIEVLTSDLAGNPEAIDRVLDAQPEIFNHNIETVRQLTAQVRHKATYDRTLYLLDRVKSHINRYLDGNYFVKSGIMVGLGESTEQVKETIRDLKETGVDIITIGQYLQASPKKLRVQAFITPEQFKEYEQYGHSIGVPHMYCGPFVRSSYNAGQVLERAANK